MDPALNPRVELSDQANGQVVADAVLLVPAGTSADRVTYTPTLPSAGTVDIYAKWSESSSRAQAVTYRIHHAGGSSDIVVNQQQPSAGWYHLGSYSVSPGQNHRVEVEGALEGETVADAVRFVSSGVSAPGIQYVHADHLGSPQKMTDSTKTIVWDAVYTPFGLVHSMTGTATNNQRFPGQYADAESGYSYNYFRDYDPTTGRYVQSDPIGLGGGLNTFGYVGGNPFKWSDPLGLFFPWDHKLATQLAARKAGCDNIADDLGQRTADVDSEPGSQDPNNAYRHAMRDGTQPDQQLALADAMSEFADLLGAQSTDTGDLAAALHALQDSFSPSHQGFQPWAGPWLGPLPTPSHIWGDFIGRYSSNFGDAITASTNFLEQAKKRNPCLCKKQ